MVDTVIDSQPSTLTKRSTCVAGTVPGPGRTRDVRGFAPEIQEHLPVVRPPGAAIASTVTSNTDWQCTCVRQNVGSPFTIGMNLHRSRATASKSVSGRATRFVTRPNDDRADSKAAPLHIRSMTWRRLTFFSCYGIIPRVGPSPFELRSPSDL